MAGNGAKESAPADLLRECLGLYSDPLCAMAEWRGVVLSLWRGSRMSAELVQRYGKLSHDVAKRLPTYRTLTVFDIAFSVPGADVRAEAEKQMKNAPRNLGCSAHVIEGSGFGVASIRAVLTGFLLIAPQRVPTKVFDGVASASEWVAATPSPATAFTAHELTEVFRLLREK